VSGATTDITVDLGGELVWAEVVRSDRARVTRIQVGRDRPLRVVVPAGASDEFARDALLSKRSWLTRKLRAVEQARSAPPALGLDTSGVVWVAGRALPVVAAGGRFAREHDGALLIPAGDQGANAVRRWYRRRAGSYLRELVAQEAARLGRSPTRVVVRDQRTRWGSCAASRTISLNWRLLLMPEAVARYVVVHELLHLDVPNHSKAFWRKLSAAYPGWQKQAAWLREHGDEVRRYQTLAATPA
jgi:predicted metal-dependent hydrolase